MPADVVRVLRVAALYQREDPSLSEAEAITKAARGYARMLARIRVTGGLWVGGGRLYCGNPAAPFHPRTIWAVVPVNAGGEE